MSSGSPMDDPANLDAIVKDVDSLKKDIAALIEQVKGGASEDLTGKTRRLYDALAADGEKSIAALTRQVEDHPLSALLIALGLGFIGAQFLKR